MKTLLMIRHAKSSWSAPSLKDFDRTLNDRGNKDAPEMAHLLKQKISKIDLMVSSTAIRARQTCEHFCKAYGVEENKILLIDDLYHAPAATLQKTIESLNAQYDCVAVFTHNPGITDFVNTLCPEVSIDDMPTTGIFCVNANITDWKTFAASEKKFLFFESPKTSL